MKTSPAVSWIVPTAAQSEHPDYLPAAGAEVSRQDPACAQAGDRIDPASPRLTGGPVRR